MRTLIITFCFLLSLCVKAQKNTSTTNKNKSTRDSIYIPTDLDDCLKRLDSMFVDSVKTKIKALTENEFSGKYHFGVGMWMRNNWGLWKGSRLSKYFNSIGVYHPDDMTGIIFDSYHRQLTGHERKLHEQIKYYQDYWEKANQHELDRKKKEFSNYRIGDTVISNYPYGFVSEVQEKMYYANKCNAKGIITGKDESKFFLKVRLLDGCDKKGIISYDNKNSQILNNKTKKLEKHKKREITYMKPGQELWLNYSGWETND